MTVALISLPYTGTRWMKRLLESWGIVPEIRHITKPDWRDYVARADKVVVMLRDRPARDASARSRPDAAPVGDGEWADLYALCARPNAHAFRIDGPDEGRDEQITALAAFLGVGAGPVDWSPVGHDDRRIACLS